MPFPHSLSYNCVPYSVCSKVSTYFSPS